MQDWHEITDAFAAHLLAYGMGTMGIWNGGKGKEGPITKCNMAAIGHEGTAMATRGSWRGPT